MLTRNDIRRILISVAMAAVIATALARLGLLGGDAAASAKTTSAKEFMDCLSPREFYPWTDRVKVNKSKMRMCLDRIVENARQGRYGPCYVRQPIPIPPTKGRPIP